MSRNVKRAERRSGFPGVVAVALLPMLVAVGCGPVHTSAEVVDLMRTSRQVVEGADTSKVPVDVLSGTAAKLRAIDRDAVAPDDLRELNKLESALDTRLASTASAVAHQEALDAQDLADIRGREVALAGLTEDRNWKDEFVEDVKDVTIEAIKGKACETLRDAALPAKDESSEPPGDEAPWLEDIVDAAKHLLAKTWRASDVEAVLDWEDWAVDVSKSADAVYATATSDPNLILTYVAQPSARMAAVEYAKFCHGLPEPP